MSIAATRNRGYHWDMNAVAEKVVEKALGLPLPLRAFVAERLIESLDAPDAPPLSAKWRKEIRRRLAEMERGSVELRDADKVFARAYASLPCRGGHAPSPRS